MVRVSTQRSQPSLTRTSWVRMGLRTGLRSLHIPGSMIRAGLWMRTVRSSSPRRPRRRRGSPTAGAGSTVPEASGEGRREASSGWNTRRHTAMAPRTSDTGASRNCVPTAPTLLTWGSSLPTGRPTPTGTLAGTVLGSARRGKAGARSGSSTRCCYRLRSSRLPRVNPTQTRCGNSSESLR